jgi:hypothetical protein
MKCMSALAFAFVAVVVTIPARAEVTQSRTDVLGGRSYGAVGSYEWLEGRAHFALDPAHLRNRAVIDLGLAPRNSRGLVEFSADIAIMRPKDQARASGVTVFDVVNRGLQPSSIFWTAAIFLQNLATHPNTSAMTFSSSKALLLSGLAGSTICRRSPVCCAWPRHRSRESKGS